MVLCDVEVVLDVLRVRWGGGGIGFSGGGGGGCSGRLILCFVCCMFIVKESWGRKKRFFQMECSTSEREKKPFVKEGFGLMQTCYFLSL
mmetsp:Transcript_2240/g.2956  ORF Transcript_2240/g.2956 Transcript_2240/m.2956 type:complete len:89 (+) Transcript_2240:910-1176(+)